jgi:hypothetical protein
MRNTIQPSYFLFNIDESKQNTYIPAYNFNFFDKFQIEMETRRKTINLHHESVIETKPKISLATKLLAKPSMTLPDFEKKMTTVSTVIPEKKQI